MSLCPSLMLAMEGYDNMSMQSYHMGGPVPQNNLGMSSTIPNASMMSLESLEHHSDYGMDPYAGSEDASQYGQSYQLQPPRSAGLTSHFSGGYDDRYSDALSNFDASASNEVQSHDAPSIDRDNKLLSFSPPTLLRPVLDYALRPVTVSLNAQLHGMFFLAESAFPSPNENSPPQTELTCYRRNLFQVTGSVNISSGLRYVLTEQGEQIPIVSQELTVSATETVEGNAVKLICVPWKTPQTNTPNADDKTEKEPPSMPLDLSEVANDPSSDCAAFPISWKRLQFRIATANNGRRRELQQHFVLRLKILATLANGSVVPICEARSGAIVVRGRSPRNFQSRKDMPIAGSGSFARRRENHQRSATTDSSTTRARAEANTMNIGEGSSSTPIGFDTGEFHHSPDLRGWTHPASQGGAMTSVPASYPAHLPNMMYPRSSPDLTRTASRTTPPRPPVALSLEDDSATRVNQILGRKVGHRKMSSASGISKKSRPMPSSARTSPFSLGPMGTSEESADTLYEYFPLGLDDWMPPVDAVYRPHVVHHTNLPADPNMLKNRSKRYFSEDQPS